MLRWQDGNGKDVLERSDGFLVHGGQGLAPWLPSNWRLNSFPAGWTLPHLERWFDYAISTAESDFPPITNGIGVRRDHPDAPTARGLVAHAHMIVRHRGIQGWHPERRQAMDRDGCIAELRELQHFVRTAILTPPVSKLPSNTIILLGDRCCQIGDSRPVVLGEPMNDVLQSFLAQPAMDERQLVTKSGRDDAVKVLRQLKDWEDGMFAPAIDFPTSKNRGGYHVRIKDARPQKTPPTPHSPPIDPCKPAQTAGQWECENYSPPQPNCHAGPGQPRPRGHCRPA